MDAIPYPVACGELWSGADSLLYKLVERNHRGVVSLACLLYHITYLPYHPFPLVIVLSLSNLPRFGHEGSAEYESRLRVLFPYLVEQASQPCRPFNGVYAPSLSQGLVHIVRPDEYGDNVRLESQHIVLPSCSKVVESVAADAAVPECPSLFGIERLIVRRGYHHVSMAVDMVHVIMVTLCRRCVPYFAVAPCPISYGVADKQHTLAPCH